MDNQVAPHKGATPAWLLKPLHRIPTIYDKRQNDMGYAIFSMTLSYNQKHCCIFALSLHKISCISAKQSSKLVDFALDLHYLCIK